MPEMNTVANRMASMRGIFRSAQEMAAESGLTPALEEILGSAEPEYRSVAYEGASMGMALKDLSDGRPLEDWKVFASRFGEAHASQLYVGLGWAMAQAKLGPSDFPADVSSLMGARIADGYGYYEGIFRQRHAIGAQAVPEQMNACIVAYTQGVGRSIWYLAEGQVQAAAALVAKFAPDRQPHLWRGLSIAASYVGGLDGKDFRDFIEMSGAHGAQLAAGALWVLNGRSKAGSPAQGADDACLHWAGLQPADALELAAKAEQSLKAFEANSYEQWLNKILQLLPAPGNPVKSALVP